MNVQHFLCILLIVFQIMSLHIWHNYGYHIANMSHRAIILNWHIEQTGLPICTKIQPTATASSHINAKYMPETNIPSNARYMPQIPISTFQILDNNVSILPHINSLLSTIQPEALPYIHLTLLAYVPQQICLPHLICMSHCNSTVVYR